jgi:hypothetical protein
MRSSHPTPSHHNSNAVSDLRGRSFRIRRATPHNSGHRIISGMRCTAYRRVRTHPHHNPNKRRQTGRQSARRRLRTAKENATRPPGTGQGTRPRREVEAPLPGPSTCIQRPSTASWRGRRPCAGFLFLSAAQAMTRATLPHRWRQWRRRGHRRGVKHFRARAPYDCHSQSVSEADANPRQGLTNGQPNPRRAETDGEYHEEVRLCRPSHSECRAWHRQLHRAGQCQRGLPVPAVHQHRLTAGARRRPVRHTGKFRCGWSSAPFESAG